MKSSIRARTAACVAALTMSGLMAGCSEQELRTKAVDAATESQASSSLGPVGSAAAAGAELTAEAIVRAWVAARNDAARTGDLSTLDAFTARGCVSCRRLQTGGRWVVDAARVTQHTVDSATVSARVTLKSAQYLDLEFTVVRVAGEPVITQIVVTP